MPMVDLTAQFRRTESRAIHGRVRYTCTMKFDLVGTLKPVSLMGLMRLLTTSTFWRINIDIETGGQCHDLEARARFIEDVLTWAERQQLSNIAADVKGVIRDARNADSEA